MADSSRWWAWQHPKIVATLLFWKLSVLLPKQLLFCHSGTKPEKKSDEIHICFGFWWTLWLESATTLEQTIQNWQKWSLPKNLDFFKCFRTEFFGFCQDLKLVFMRFHELIPSTSYHHSKNKKWRKKQISKISARDERYKNSYRTSINIDWNFKKCSKTWKNKIFKKYWKTFSTVNLVILWYL